MKQFFALSVMVFVGLLFFAGPLQARSGLALVECENDLTACHEWYKKCVDTQNRKHRFYNLPGHAYKLAHRLYVHCNKGHFECVKDACPQQNLHN